MPGSYLLDTNGVIASFRGDAAIRARIEAADEIFMAAAFLGELYFGAEKSRRGRENLARVEAFLKLCPVLPAGAEVARRWGQLRQAQKRKVVRFPTMMSG